MFWYLNIVELSTIILCSSNSNYIRDRYYNIHEKADNVIFACKKSEKDCYEVSDRIMIDNSDMIVIFGTEKDNLYADRYANEKGKTIRFIWLKKE